LKKHGIIQLENFLFRRAANGTGTGRLFLMNITPYRGDMALDELLLHAVDALGGRDGPEQVGDPGKSLFPQDGGTSATAH